MGGEGAVKRAGGAQVSALTLAGTSRRLGRVGARDARRQSCETSLHGMVLHAAMPPLAPSPPVLSPTPSQYDESGLPGGYDVSGAAGEAAGRAKGAAAGAVESARGTAAGAAEGAKGAAAGAAQSARETAAGAAESASETVAAAQDKAAGVAQSARETAAAGTEAAAEAAGRATGAVQGVGQAAAEGASSAAQSAKETAASTAAAAQEKAAGAAQAAKETAGGAAESARAAGAEVAGRASEAAQVGASCLQAACCMDEVVQNWKGKHVRQQTTQHRYSSLPLSTKNRTRSHPCPPSAPAFPAGCQGDSCRHCRSRPGEGGWHCPGGQGNRRCRH